MTLAGEYVAAHGTGPGDDLEVEAIEYLRIRLLVVDPHPLVRWALGQIAAGRPDLVQVGEAATMDEAIALCFAVKPDVITIDDSLMGEDLATNADAPTSRARKSVWSDPSADRITMPRSG